MKRFAIMMMLALASMAFSAAQAEKERQTPYWASISSGKAMMRTGPARTYPATWLYVRADLPIKVIETYPSWRKIQDPDGQTGWMLVNLLSDQRTALVTGEAPRPLHDSPDEASPALYKAEPGVVGRLSECQGDWCRLDVGGRQGFIKRDHIWGTDPDEVID